MMPARDPLRSLAHSPADRAIGKVFIDGRVVADQGEGLALNHAAVCEALTEVQAGMITAVLEFDWAPRQADPLTPLTLPLVAGSNGLLGFGG
jgi:5-methylthioadenosine/S-adenosylhomocysteine deaminase